MNYIIDSYAWIEYLDGSKVGNTVNNILSGGNEIFSLNLIISEVISRVKRVGGDVDIAYKAITSNSKIIELTPKLSKETGLFHAEIRKKIKDFGLVDSFLLILAKSIKAKILTRDKHFKGFKEAIFIG